MTEPTRLVTGPQAREEARDAAEPTELAATETETASVHAWGLDDDDDEPTSRLTPGRITGAAVATSLLALAAVGLMAWQLRTDTVTPEAVSSTMVPATMTTAVPIAVTPQSPPPPPLVTITTVIKQVPAPTTGWVPAPTQSTNVGIPPDVVAMYDQRLVANLQADNWNIWDPAAIAKSAHQVCAALQRGDEPWQVRQQLVAAGPLTDVEAASFTSNVMRTYPDCP